MAPDSEAKPIFCSISLNGKDDIRKRNTHHIDAHISGFFDVFERQSQ